MSLWKSCVFVFFFFGLLSFTIHQLCADAKYSNKRCELLCGGSTREHMVCHYFLFGYNYI